MAALTSFLLFSALGFAEKVKNDTVEATVKKKEKNVLPDDDERSVQQSYSGNSYSNLNRKFC